MVTPAPRSNVVGVPYYLPAMIGHEDEPFVKVWHGEYTLADVNRALATSVWMREETSIIGCDYPTAPAGVRW